MYCHKCGNNMKMHDQFCDRCGQPAVTSSEERSETDTSTSSDKWWQRLAKVVYIFLWLQILWIVPTVWMANNDKYEGYYGGQFHYTNTDGKAFWYSVLSVVLFLISIRLLKITLQYIFLGKKPLWRKQFKQLF